MLNFVFYSKVLNDDIKKVIYIAIVRGVNVAPWCGSIEKRREKRF